MNPTNLYTSCLQINFDKLLKINLQILIYAVFFESYKKKYIN